MINSNSFQKKYFVVVLILVVVSVTFTPQKAEAKAVVNVVESVVETAVDVVKTVAETVVDVTVSIVDAVIETAEVLVKASLQPIETIKDIAGKIDCWAADNVSSDTFGGATCGGGGGESSSQQSGGSPSDPPLDSPTPTSTPTPVDPSGFTPYSPGAGSERSGENGQPSEQGGSGGSETINNSGDVDFGSNVSVGASGKWVDIKANNLDGPVTIIENNKVNLTWGSSF